MKSTVSGETPPQSLSPERSSSSRRFGREVRRRLHVHRGAEQQARHRHPAGDLGVAERRDVAHARVGLGMERLDDHLLDVAQAIGEVADHEQGVDALGGVLADAEQDAAREGDPELAGLLVHADAHGGILVGRPEVGAAALAQARAGRLEHQAQRRVHAAQPLHLLAPQDPGVGVRQHADPEGDLAGLHQILGGGAQPALREPFAVRAVGDLGLVAEAEERLDAARAYAAARHLGDLVERVGLRVRRVRELREGAVVAAIAAQVGERDEDVAREADELALAAPLALAGAFQHGFAHARVGEARAEPARPARARADPSSTRLRDQALGLAPRERRLGGGRLNTILWAIDPRRAGVLGQYTTQPAATRRLPTR